MFDINDLRVLVAVLLLASLWFLSSDLVLRIARKQIDARSASIGVGMIIALLPVCYSAWYASRHEFPYNPGVVFGVGCDLILAAILGYWVARDVWHLLGQRKRGS